MQSAADSPLVVVVGPTAVGKTAIAIHLAQALHGEIVSADSRQVYRYMDIGTAKPTPQELQQASHHLVNILDPDEQLTLAEFQSKAYAAIETVLSAGKLPILAGGTGQYVRAVVEGWEVPRVPPQPTLRADLEHIAEVYSPAVLYARLAQVDPPAAQAIDWRNTRRLVRALEVFLASGRPITALQSRHPPPYRILWIGLTRPRPALYARIDARVDRMMADGLLDEVENLVKRGYGWHLPAMSSLGYAQIGAYLRGQMTLEEAVAAIKRATRTFVRRQYNWFPLDDPAIPWLDLEQVSPEEIVAVVRSRLHG